MAEGQKKVNSAHKYENARHKGDTFLGFGGAIEGSLESIGTELSTPWSHLLHCLAHMVGAVLTPGRIYSHLTARSVLQSTLLISNNWSSQLPTVSVPQWGWHSVVRSGHVWQCDALDSGCYSTFLALSWRYLVHCMSQITACVATRRVLYGIMATFGTIQGLSLRTASSCMNPLYDIFRLQPQSLGDNVEYVPYIWLDTPWKGEYCHLP